MRSGRQSFFGNIGNESQSGMAASRHSNHKPCGRPHLECAESMAIPMMGRRMSAVTVCFVFSVAILSCVCGAAQDNAVGTNSQPQPGKATITANPDRVGISGGTGSTEIEWDTGNGAPGFVFLRVNEDKPVLFVAGPKGARVAPWIRAGNYSFELYGDADRQMLLAAVTVIGVAETEAAPQMNSWRGKARWVLLFVLLAIVYGAVYLSSTGTLRTTFPTEPTSSSRPLHVTRNFFLGAAAFICLDGLIFHTPLYVSILAPDSYAGRLIEITRAEKERPASGLKEVLVLGDSRIAEGFSSGLADELGSTAGFKFVNLAEPAASVNTWYYMLRDVDPAERRYWAVVVPYGIGYEPSTADALRISMVAPLLRYEDCFNFASGFPRWSGRFRAFTASILRGSAYQGDVSDFLSNPMARIRSAREERHRLHSRAAYKGRDYDLVGTSYNASTGQLTFSPKLTEAQRQAVRKSLLQPSQSDMQYFVKLERDWIPRIVNRYSKSSTKVVLTPVPRGLFRELNGSSAPYDVVFSGVTMRRPIVALPEQTFDFLEQPDYYFDAYHLNAKGRERFTERLVTELLGRLGSAGAGSGFTSEVTTAAMVQ